jgi:site-specific recombinase
MEITLDTPAGYLHWGFILISIPNLLLIGLMIVLFALALFIPLPGEKEKA